MVNIIAKFAESELQELIKEYTGYIETAETGKVCKCLWAVHPDDRDIQTGHCRVCNHEPHPDVSAEGEEAPGGFAHKFLGKRMRLFEQDEFCPAHTKEGLLLGFFKWLENRNG